MWVTQAVLESLENNMLKWYGHVVRIDDKIWGNRILTRSPEGRRRRGRPEVKWEKKIESVMKQRNLTSDDAVNRQLWRLKTGNRSVAGKHR
jgi:lysozyme family protein